MTLETTDNYLLGVLSAQGTTTQCVSLIHSSQANLYNRVRFTTVQLKTLATHRLDEL